MPETFNWKDYIETSSLSRKYIENSVDDSALLFNQLDMLENIAQRILDHETADKDNDGKIDDPNVRKLFEDIKKFCNGKIQISATYLEFGLPSDEKNAMIPLFHILNYGCIDSNDGKIYPRSFNAVLLHEIQHSVDSTKIQKLNKDKNYLELSEQYYALQAEQKKFGEGSKEFMEVEGRKAIVEQEKFDYAQKEYGLSKELVMRQAYYGEESAVKMENAIASKHGEIARTSYILMARLEKPLTELIYFTDDNKEQFDKQKFNQSITRKDIEHIKKSLEEWWSISATKEKWLNELLEFEKNMIKKDVIKPQLDLNDIKGLNGAKIGIDSSTGTGQLTSSILFNTILKKENHLA